MVLCGCPNLCLDSVYYYFSRTSFYFYCFSLFFVRKFLFLFVSSRLLQSLGSCGRSNQLKKIDRVSYRPFGGNLYNCALHSSIYSSSNWPFASNRWFYFISWTKATSIDRFSISESSQLNRINICSDIGGGFCALLWYFLNEKCWISNFDGVSNRGEPKQPAAKKKKKKTNDRDLNRCPCGRRGQFQWPK